MKLLQLQLHIEDYPFTGFISPKPEEVEARFVYDNPFGVFFDGENVYNVHQVTKFEEEGFSDDGMRSTGGIEFTDYVPGEICQDVPDKIMEELKKLYNMSENERFHYENRKEWHINARKIAMYITKTSPVYLCLKEKTFSEWQAGVDVGNRTPNEKEKILMEALGLTFVNNFIKSK